MSYNLWPGAKQVLVSCVGCHALADVRTGSVQGGQWEHHGPGPQQSPGGELWGHSSVPFYSGDVDLPQSQCLLRYPDCFPLFDQYQILLVKLHRRVLTQSVRWQLTRWALFMMKYFHLWPVASHCDDDSDLTMSVTGGCVNTGPPHRGHTRRSSVTSSASIGWADEMFSVIGWISHERATTSVRAGSHGLLYLQNNLLIYFYHKNLFFLTVLFYTFLK